MLKSDCRQPFLNLVELTKRNQGGCCTLVLRPEDFQTISLQNLLDQLPADTKATLCFMPGEYLLAEPLVIGRRHDNLTLEGCHDGVEFRAVEGREDNFLQGLIILNRANNVTLRRLRFYLPLVPFLAAGGTLARLSRDQSNRLLGRTLTDLQVAIGLRPIHCAQLTIQDCLFRYSFPDAFPLFTVGIFAGSECWGLQVKNNRFLNADEYSPNEERPPLRLLAGLLVAPTLTLDEYPSPTRSALPTGSLIATVLQDAVLTENRFVGLTHPVLVIAETGQVDLASNTVSAGFAGFWFCTLRAFLAPVEYLRESLAATGSGLYFSLTSTLLNDPRFILPITLAQSYPLPKVYRPDEDRYTTPRAEDSKFSVSNEGAVLGVPFSFINDLELLKQNLVSRTPPQPPLPLALDLAHNTVTCLPPVGPSGLPLLVWDTPTVADSFLRLTGNQLRNSSLPLPTALLLFVQRTTVTGNLILNESPTDGDEKFSLVLLAIQFHISQFGTATALPAYPIAVTGNVLQGYTALPVRNYPAPLNTWLVFNTQYF